MRKRDNDIRRVIVCAPDEPFPKRLGALAQSYALASRHCIRSWASHSTSAETCYPWESAEPREGAVDAPEDLVAEPEEEQLLRRRAQGEEAGQVDGVDLSRTARAGVALL